MEISGHTATDLHVLLFCSPRQGWRGASLFPSLGGYKDTFGSGLDSGRPVAHWEARPRFRFRVRRLFFEMKAVQMWSFNRSPCAVQTSATYCALFLLFLFLSQVDAVCPHCFGIFNGCTFDTNSKCPSVETVSANARVIAAGGVGVLSLVALIRPPYLRTFTLATIELLLAVVRRPAPGTEFEVYYVVD